MNEEKIYDAPEMTEEVVEETVEEVTEEVVETEIPQQTYVAAEPVKAKKGFATAALVFGILAFITTLFLLNYVFGILALIFGIAYLAKKADIKPKGKAVAGVVLASLSLIISTTIWVSAYIYITQTNVTDIIEDVSGLVGEPVDGEEFVNQQVQQMTGGAVDLDTIEQFVGGEVSVDRIMDFVGDVNQEEITAFIEDINTMDEDTMIAIMTEFEGELTYEKLEEKLGKDFTLEEIMEYIEGFKK